MPHTMRLAALIFAILLAGTGTGSVLGTRLGPNAHALRPFDPYLIHHPNSDLRAFLPYYVNQSTPAGCSVASAAMLINALLDEDARHASARPIRQDALIAAVGDERWRRATRPTGDGVTFAAFVGYLRESLDAYGFSQARIEVFQPNDASAATRRALTEILAKANGPGNDFILVAFDQGTLTGDEHDGHISPIAAFDPSQGRALVLDVDRAHFPAYWTSVDALLAAMLYPDPTDPSGSGLLLIHLPRPYEGTSHG